MDFGLSTEQDILKRSAREFLAAECPMELCKAMETDERGCPPALWHKVADLAWTALPFPDRYGGAGGSILDLTVLLEEMGRATFPSAFFTSVVLGGLTILEAGSEAQKSELLPVVAAGNMICTLANLEPSGSFGPAGVAAIGKRAAAGYTITGTKIFVPDVQLADGIIGVARTADRRANREGISLILVRTKNGTASGVAATALKTMAGDKQFEVVFADAQGELLGEAETAWPALNRVLQVAAVGKCAEMLGAAQRALDLSVEHGHNRSQFGRPIGSFQAVQYHCADMVTDIDLSRLLTYQAAWSLSEGQEATRQVGEAKAFVSDAYMRVCTLAHQVLAGNGLIEEHEMPLFSKRAPGRQLLFGSPDYHRDAIVRSYGL